jgi:hypothetical protein
MQSSAVYTTVDSTCTHVVESESFERGSTVQRDEEARLMDTRNCPDTEGDELPRVTVGSLPLRPGRRALQAAHHPRTKVDPMAPRFDHP